MGKEFLSFFLGLFLKYQVTQLVKTQGISNNSGKGSRESLHVEKFSISGVEKFILQVFMTALGKGGFAELTWIPSDRCYR